MSLVSNHNTLGKKPLVEELFSVPNSLRITETPPPPETLTASGIFWWTYYCGLLVEANIFSRMFVGTVRDVCHVRQTIDALEASILAEGHIILVAKKFNGQEYTEPAANPMIPVVARLYQDFDKLANSLGLTPFSAKVNAIDTSGEREHISTPPPSDLLPPETIPFKTA